MHPSQLGSEKRRRVDTATRLQGVLRFEFGEELGVFLDGGMGWAKFPAGRIGGATSEIFGFGKFLFTGQVAGEVVTGVEGFEMIGAAKLLGDPQDFAILGLGGGILALVKERVSEATMAPQSKSVIRP